ncbi:hypothetical protein GWI33_016905 [Rhynchophorus ferrugineus]|uniref:Uncharacterized protein n=1 Tax=Rhynchophorus ferrugineus TaxID=354439 RepID=A0A834M877_RHYFE|nr:hypothetical protein GWI33_016905 [Rhynchophorus ferrugineus]
MRAETTVTARKPPKKICQPFFVVAAVWLRGWIGEKGAFNRLGLKTFHLRAHRNNLLPLPVSPSLSDTHRHSVRFFAIPFAGSRAGKDFCSRFSNKGELISVVRGVKSAGP